MHQGWHGESGQSGHGWTTFWTGLNLFPFSFQSLTEICKLCKLILTYCSAILIWFVTSRADSSPHTPCVTKRLPYSVSMATASTSRQDSEPAPPAEALRLESHQPGPSFSFPKRPFAKSLFNIPSKQAGSVPGLGFTMRKPQILFCVFYAPRPSSRRWTQEMQKLLL